MGVGGRTSPEPEPGPGSTTLTVEELARLTPASRDRFMDFLRAASISAVVIGHWFIGAVMLLRHRLSRWLEGTRAWKATIAVNGMVMTLFLWHMTAYLLVILALWPLGFGHEHEGTARWWLERPIWLGIPALVLAGLVAVFSRFERPQRPPRP